MQRCIAPYIKHSSENNNSSSWNERLQLGTGILGVFSVLVLIYQTRKNEGGGYKQTNAVLVRNSAFIYLSYQELKGKQDLENKSYWIGFQVTIISPP